MWNISRALNFKLLQHFRILAESHRNVYVLKRINEVELSKLGSHPKKLNAKHYIYELVEDTNRKKRPPLDLILLKDIPGLGMIGDRVQMNCFIGYRDFILPKLAVYANSPEAKNVKRSQDSFHYSSIYSRIVEQYLTLKPLQIILSQSVKWTLKPWHVKVALRKVGVIVKDDCIVLPEKVISGPDPEIENKDFVITLVMNKSEKFSIRCRIYHWESENPDFHTINENEIFSASECLFPEEQVTVDELLKKENDFRKSSKMSALNKIVKI